EDEFIAPLLCAGAVGYRSLKLAEIRNGETLGFMGFGASAHLVLKIAKMIYPDTKIIVFARKEEERNFALNLGADWALDIEENPPEKPKAIIDTTPVWKPVISSLRALQKGGRLVINAIRKESSDKNELLNLDYAGDIWLEKEVKSVANVARKDVKEFLELAFEHNIKPEVQIYSFENARKALIDIKEKNIKGAKVLIVD
ncbi:MAG: alcohol dehydrogenase, partial [Acidobacteria bacterium]|nr:alcohol dehydrogenase [Acidobacteriota bacterium]